MFNSLMNNLKTGELKTKELVKIFGTKKQQDNYTKDKRLNTTAKQRILTKAKNFCDIEDLGKGKFIIHKVHNIDKDDLILPLLKGLSKFLTPLILTKLLTEQDSNYKVTLPFLGWAKKFEMVNDNYPLIKYHQKQSSDYLKIDSDIMFDYFERMDECIKYYLDKCLSTLSNSKGLDLLEFDSVKMVKKVILEPSLDDNNIKIVCGYVDEVISDQDRKFVIDCENKAKVKVNITNSKEKFYGVKSHIYKKELKKLLGKRNILFTYSAYNIFCKNPEEIKNVLSKFESLIDYKNENFIQTFNENFIDYIENKAKSRQNREMKKLDDENTNMNFIKKHRLTETYISDFKMLSELTVHKNSKDLKDVIKIDDIEDILEEFNINIIKL